VTTLIYNDLINGLEVDPLVPIYLMSSYLYYELDKNVLDDHQFDQICRRLYREFDNITHYHKHLLDKDSLGASTGYQLKYPTIVKHAAMLWYNENNKI
jgi:NAD-dependent DNA ligase